LKYGNKLIPTSTKGILPMPNTPLHVAIKNDNAEIVQMLLNAGHGPCTPSEVGITPIQFATQLGRAKIIAILNDRIKSNSTANVAETAETTWTVNTAQKVIEDLQQTSFKSEIIPVDKSNVVILCKNRVFWSVLTLGVTPILILTLGYSDLQLIALLFFFGMLWGAALRGVVVRSGEKIALPITAFFFTGFIGIPLYFIVCVFQPEYYVALPYSENLILRLFGSIFHTGVWEELCKILPVIIYLWWKKRETNLLQS